MRTMLAEANKERPEGPALYVTDRCTQFIRTVPSLPRDSKDLDDVDTNAEDHCLHGDTLVRTENGDVPIRDLVGTTGRALSSDGLWHTYSDCRLTRRDAEVWRVNLKDGRSIVSTPDHRFMTPNGFWLTIGDMVLYDYLKDIGGPRTYAVVGWFEPAGTADVYNLEVEDTHDFAVAGGIIVHNCGDDARYQVMAAAPPSISTRAVSV
jgi:hypothetical protein